MVTDFTLITNSIQSTPLLKAINCESSKVDTITDMFPLKKGESPIIYCDRIAKDLLNECGNQVSLSVFNSVFIGRRLIGVPQNKEEMHKILKLYSGRNHIVYTSIVLKNIDGKLLRRRTSTRIKIKNLSTKEIEQYLLSNQWQGQNGGYNFMGLFQKFIIQITGSYSGAMGMPCYEIANLLQK